MGIKKAYAGAVGFYLIALLVYVSYGYIQQRSALLAKIDTRLTLCATVADQLLPPSLHAFGMKAGTLSPEQDLHNRLVLSKYAHSMGVKYVYSIILQDEKIYFTSSSATAEELKTGEGISYYYDVYDDASPLLVKALLTRKTQFDEYTDKWGHFRSIFMPHVSKDGRVYVTGADIEISNIKSQLHALMLNSLGEALFYILILVPFFIAYRIQNLSIRQELIDQVNERTADLEERSRAIARLLNNANQGFLSFSRSLAVEGEYSKKCFDIFERPIEGERIGALLYPDELAKREFFEETFQAVFDETDEVKVDAILSLLPHEFIINSKAIDAVYKMIEAGRCMVILTDITDKKNLEKSIERERNILKMVVSAIGNRDEFFELVDDFRQFLAHRYHCVDKNLAPMENLTEVYRRIHTYKGLFAQHEFVTTVQALHKVETKFASWLQGSGVSNATLQTMMSKIDFELWLEKDLAVLHATLGEEFFEKKASVAIDDVSFERIHAKIVHLIQEQPDSCYELVDLLDVLQRLKYKPIKEYFASLIPYAQQLAARLEKSIYPLVINDTSNLTASDAIKPFAKSLIHVLRNSVDHGIESPEERVEENKDENGTILLQITQSGESVSFEITDDGRGVDVASLKAKAMETGILNEHENLSDEEILNLVFEDYLSTKDEVSELSGRGVGLSSVRSEVEKLNGHCRIVSTPMMGTSFIFTFPKSSIVKEQ